MQVAVWADLARGIVQRGVVGMVIALKHVSVTCKDKYGSSGSMSADGHIVYDDGSRGDFSEVAEFEFYRYVRLSLFVSSSSPSAHRRYNGLW
jgi:hypothetical protein